jgi:hypothetical protein
VARIFDTVSNTLIVKDCGFPGVIELLVAANWTIVFPNAVKYDAGIPDDFVILSVDDPPIGLENVYEKGSYE